MELVSRCVECGLAEPESLASLGGSAPGVVDGILSKLGDTKQWNGKTYYWCPANHKHSHWHTHKVEECNTYKKMLKEQNKSTSEDKKEVSVDENKLKKGMAAIFPSGDFNTDDLAEALAAAINGVE